jgi:hypothetical protein
MKASQFTAENGRFSQYGSEEILTIVGRKDDEEALWRAVSLGK